MLTQQIEIDLQVQGLLALPARGVLRVESVIASLVLSEVANSGGTIEDADAILNAVFAWHPVRNMRSAGGFWVLNNANTQHVVATVMNDKSAVVWSANQVNANGDEVASLLRSHAALKKQGFSAKSSTDSRAMRSNRLRVLSGPSQLRGRLLGDSERLLPWVQRIHSAGVSANRGFGEAVARMRVLSDVAPGDDLLASDWAFLDDKGRRTLPVRALASEHGDIRAGIAFPHRLQEQVPCLRAEVIL
ncbi:MAG: hypothetical protein ACYCTG_06615 [Ferrimicrobium sp.]